MHHKIKLVRNCHMISGKIILLATIVCIATPSFTAQETTQSAQEIAEKLANPVANMISVPLQNNLQYGIGEHNGSRYTLNLQPIIPLSLGKNMNLITRYIVPFIDQRDIIADNTGQLGLGDMTFSAYLTPKKSGKIIIGAGPILLIPTATDEFLGTKKLSVGPTVVGLVQTKGASIGALVNQFWSVAGDSKREDISELFVQVFYTHSYKSGASIGFNAEMTQNWEGNTTTVIFNGPSIGAVTVLGKQKVQLSVMPVIPILGPSASRPDWGIRASINFIFLQ